MTLIYRLLIIVGTLTALFLFAGCGPNATIGTTGLPIAPSLSAMNGSVTLHVDAQSYRIGDTISVTLSNQSNQTIFFPDHLTNCTVILLQRQKVQPLAGENVSAIFSPCRLAIATRIHSLGAGERLVVRLVAPLDGWVPGFYRATLSYRTSLNAGPSTTIYSAVFTVGSFGPLP